MDGAEGPYPTIEKNIDGDDVFIVTSYRTCLLSYISLLC